MEYCLTEIPKDLVGFALIQTNEVYDNAYWSQVAEKIKKENEAYEKLEEFLAPSPEDLRKQFAM